MPLTPVEAIPASPASERRTNVAAAPFGCAAVAHRPRRTASGERGTAEAEEEQLVVGLVRLHEEPIGVRHVVGQSHPEGPTAQPLPLTGSDAAVVMDALLLPGSDPGRTDGATSAALVLLG